MPHVLATQQVTNYWSGCAVGECLYLSRWQAAGAKPRGIQVLDIADPRRPTEVQGCVPFDDALYHVWPAGKDLLVATSTTTAQLLSLADPRRPVPVGPAVRGISGRVAVVQQRGEEFLLVTGRAVHRIEKTGLVQVRYFAANSGNVSGFPYHGDTDGEFVVITADHQLVLLAGPVEAQRRRRASREALRRPRTPAASPPTTETVSAPALAAARTVPSAESLAFSPDGKLLFTGSGLYTGSPKLDSWFPKAALSSDGSRAAMTFNGRTGIWEIPSDGRLPLDQSDSAALPSAKESFGRWSQWAKKAGVGA